MTDQRTLRDFKSGVISPLEIKRVQWVFGMVMCLFISVQLACFVTVWSQPIAPSIERIQLDLNECTDAELRLLPSIGPKTASRILDHRHQFGPFATVDEIDRVPGIGPVTVAKIRPYLTVSHENSPLLAHRTFDSRRARE